MVLFWRLPLPLLLVLLAASPTNADGITRCPGGFHPAVDSNNLLLKTCDGSKHFKISVEGVQLCCNKPRAKDFADVTELSPFDASTHCKRNSDCPGDQFCGESIIDGPREVLPLMDKILHCYSRPKYSHLLGTLSPNQGLIACSEHEECNLNNNPALCAAGWINVGIPTRKFCFENQCPYTKALTNYAICTSQSECKAGEICINAIGHVKHCCPVPDDFKCHARTQYPYPRRLSPSCVNGSTPLTGKQGICCQKFIYKLFGDTNPLAPVGEKQCAKDDECGASEFCGPSMLADMGEYLLGSPKHCYKRFVHGDGSVYLDNGNTLDCSDDSTCEGSLIRSCKAASSTVNRKICFQSNCPLWLERNPIDNAMFGQTCTVDSACSAGSHCVSLFGDEKRCCPIEPTFLCPGGVLPVLGAQDKPLTTCDPAKHFLHSGGTLCCPKVVLVELLADKKSVEPVKPDGICQKNSDCQPDEFCGTSTLLENVASPNPKTLEVNGLRVHHCYKRPLCSGTTVLDPNIGLKSCSKNGGSCGVDETCDMDLGAVNHGRFGGIGVCCHYKCSGSVPEGKQGDKGKSGKTCDCKGETKAQAFCDKNLQNDENTINVCEATGVGRSYRQCTYARDTLRCDSEYLGVLRRKGSNEVVLCSNNVDCQGASKEIDQGASLCTSPVNPRAGFNKICCKADLCPDLFTFREKQNVCTKEEECAWNEENVKMPATCRGDILGQSTVKYCCPQTEFTGKMEVIYPFNTKTSCGSLEQCFGDGRFCDPITGQCMYSWGSQLHTLLKTSFGTCKKNDRICKIDPRDEDDNRIVCLTPETTDSTSAPECYRHPLDMCETNGMCSKRNEYCAPKKGTSDAEYDKAFRMCHTAPKNAIVRKNELGLFKCKNQADCISSDFSCVTSDSTVAIKPGFGYCKRNFELTCRGAPTIEYTTGDVNTCATNNDCGENDFCDMDIDRPASISRDRGICCSKPVCGGETAVKEAGIKICTDDSGCSKSDGEICITDIAKPAESSWKANEGVCCKTTCPTLQHPEATTDIPTAGPICNARNCQNSTEKIILCVGGDNSTYTRCCQYSRKADICPTGTDGPVRDDNDARLCNTTDSSEECPVFSECLGGFCCKQKLCSDGKTQLNIQRQCSAEKDCNQPAGASASCEKGHCCPKVSNGKVTEPFVTATPCSSVMNCTTSKTYCDSTTKKCTYIGSTEGLVTDMKCKKEDSSCTVKKGVKGVCLFLNGRRNQVPSCYMDPLRRHQVQSDIAEVEESSVVLGSILGIVAMVLATIGVGGTLCAGYYKVSKKNVRDKMRKAEKAFNKDKKKKQKEEKTGEKEMWKEESEMSQVDQSQMSVAEKPSEASVVDSKLQSTGMVTM